MKLPWRRWKNTSREFTSLQWRHNEPYGVSNDQRLNCLLNRCSGVDQRKHQSSTSLAFVRGIHWWPVNSQHNRPVTRKILPSDDVIMWNGHTRHENNSLQNRVHILCDILSVSTNILSILLWSKLWVSTKMNGLLIILYISRFQTFDYHFFFNLLQSFPAWWKTQFASGCDKNGLSMKREGQFMDVVSKGN